jgi:hypothetical protein
METWKNRDLVTKMMQRGATAKGVYCLRLTVHSSLFTVHGLRFFPLPTVHRPLSTAHRPLHAPLRIAAKQRAWKVLNPEP